MNQSARLFYHLQEKEEKLRKQADLLEASEREFHLKQLEQDAMLRITKERMENKHILFQTKLESLGNLLQLKEEGYKQKLEYASHQSEMKELIYRDQIQNLTHKSELKDMILSDKIDRLHDHYQNEKVLENIDHHRELLGLDQTIATKMQEIFLMERDIKKWQDLDVLREEKMSIIKEQNVLESKSRQVTENLFKQQGQYIEWKEEYLASLERFKERELSLKEKNIELYYREASHDLNVRDRELDIKNTKNETYKDYLNSREERITSEYNKMFADFSIKENELYTDLRERKMDFREKYMKRRQETFDKHKQVWREAQKANRERFRFYKVYSDNAEELEEIKRSVAYESEHLEGLKKEQQQVYWSKVNLENEKKALAEKIADIKENLPSGK